VDHLQSVAARHDQSVEGWLTHHLRSYFKIG
jgi:hypothetical protein